jgi:hypothetical protein
MYEREGTGRRGLEIGVRGAFLLSQEWPRFLLVKILDVSHDQTRVAATCAMKVDPTALTVFRSHIAPYWKDEAQEMQTPWKSRSH